MEGKRESFANWASYHLLKWSIVSPALHIYFRLNLHGAENVPNSGGVVAVSNHASYFDPPILSNCVGRPVAFMAKEELFKIPVLKQGIKLYGAYPVKRRMGDRAALRAATKAIESGWIAAVFLQGTRDPDAQITEPKLGAAWIAAKMQVPLLPVSLWGTEKILIKGSALPKSVPITVRIGEVISPPLSTKKEDLQAVTEHCAAVINALHDLGR
ncbi:1-acyl-sn-glycerol-3-phosphate acyltransferase [Pleurocapsa sp. CCALA 161]|uniref:lysophospholipid acyltransferase family protein n=1 Tax=Pleurocapsa sp. CCALA 161 TaxID=2107688 RepID=UPI000D0669FE|nr:lysophospholipid acyltransferase family protein [Pleurocapsa sp. CCALA 161]PSB08732.1 1-acyl-sn-glycerol-3-phosphate acyltransferase [Pleurocapsa sp. CCALA 161]